MNLYFCDVWSEIFFTFISSKKLSSSAHISRNPNITQKTVENHPEFNWDYFHLCKNPNMTFDFFISCKDKSMLNWCAISRHPNVTMENFKTHPYEPWNIENLGKNPNVTMETILSNPQISWHNLGKNKNITIYDVINNPSLKWDWTYLTQNANMTMDVIKNNLRRPWDWKNMVENPNVTFEFVEKYLRPSQLADFAYYFSRPTLQNVLLNIDRFEWRMYRLSSSENVTLDEILENMESPDSLQWDLSSICCNPNVKMTDIARNQDILMPVGFTQMHVNSICCNPNLTLQYLAKHEEEWNGIGIEIDWNLVCHNNFELDRNAFVENGVTRVLLMEIHYHCEHKIACYVGLSIVERVLMDCHMVKHIMKY